MSSTDLWFAEDLDGLVFDLDGTLWDTSEVVARAWTQALLDLDLLRTVTANDIAGIMGLTHQQIFPKLFPDLASEVWEAFAQQCYHREHEFIGSQGGRLYGGVSQGLARLARQFPLYIVSNCQRGYIEQFLEVTGLGPLFKGFECHGNTGRPKGENIVTLVGRHGLKKTLYVGDTHSDGEAARQAGLPFLFVEYGFGECDSAHMRFSEFEDCVDWILRHQSVLKAEAL